MDRYITPAGILLLRSQILGVFEYQAAHSENMTSILIIWYSSTVVNLEKNGFGSSNPGQWRTQ